MSKFVTKYPGNVFGSANFIAFRQTPRRTFWRWRQLEPMWRIYLLKDCGDSEMVWCNCSEDETVSMIEVMEAYISSWGSPNSEPSTPGVDGGSERESAIDLAYALQAAKKSVVEAAKAWGAAQRRGSLNLTHERVVALIDAVAKLNALEKANAS